MNITDQIAREEVLNIPKGLLASWDKPGTFASLRYNLNVIESLAKVNGYTDLELIPVLGRPRWKLVGTRKA